MVEIETKHFHCVALKKRGHSTSRRFREGQGGDTTAPGEVINNKIMMWGEMHTPQLKVIAQIIACHGAFVAVNRGGWPTGCMQRVAAVSNTIISSAT
jgi:hypothetical protein